MGREIAVPFPAEGFLQPLGWCPNQVGMARCAVRAAFSGARCEMVWNLGGEVIHFARCYAGEDIAARCPYRRQIRTLPPQDGN